MGDFGPLLLEAPMSSQTAFRPLAATQNIAVTATAQTHSFNYTLGMFGVRFVNIGTQTVFLLPRMRTDATAATVTNSIPLPAGQTEVFTMGLEVDNISVIAPATGSTLYTTVGEGL